MRRSSLLSSVARYETYRLYRRRPVVMLVLLVILGSAVALVRASFRLAMGVIKAVLD